jgi:hypothetical protein
MSSRRVTNKAQEKYTGKFLLILRVKIKHLVHSMVSFLKENRALKLF